MQTVMMIFHGIGVLVTLLNVLTYFTLRRRLITAFPKRGRLVSWLILVPFFVLLHMAIAIAIAGPYGIRFAREMVPQWLGIAGMTFQLAVWFYGAFLLFVGSPAAITGAIRRLRRMARRDESGTQPEREMVNEDRRRLITRAALGVPVAMLATAAGGAVAARQTPVVTRLQLPVPRELTALHGVTIAQISDVHVGSYMDRERLETIAQAMNSLGADYHVMTGDLMDDDISQMDHSQQFLRALSPRLQKFMCMGNHEYIPAMRSADVPQILRGLRETGVELLIDESRKLARGGQHLWLMGIDYPPQGGTHTVFQRATDRDTEQSLDEALKDVRDDGAPRILLSHHPKTFFQARERQIDLTLSGHMHGGQLVAGRLGDYVLSPVLPFEHYHKGLYVHNGRKLYVNSGAGGWMPVRVNCPPEITLVELVKA